MSIFTQYARESSTRHKQAFDSLYQQLSDRFPMLPDVARKVAVYYVKNKIAKLDPYHGVYSVAHGRLLDPEIIARCAEMVSK